MLLTAANKIQTFFSKPSKTDGRFVVLLCLACYFISIYVASFFMEADLCWKYLGVPANPELFGDMHVVTTALKCASLGYDVYNPNPCFASIFAYPKIWFAFSSVWVSPENNTLFAVIIIVLYFASILVFIQRINFNEGIYYGLLLCSPACMLAVERCQPDLIIFMLCCAAILIMRKWKNTYLSSAFLLFAGALKFYPFATAVAYADENRKRTFFLVTLLVAFSIGYVMFNYRDIQKINHTLNEYFFTKSVGALYGCMVFVNLLHTYPFFHHLFLTIPKSMLVYGSILVVVLVLIFISRSLKLKPESGKHLFAFKVGASLYVGSFLIGSNYDYKLIMFIFVIPQLIEWLKNSGIIRTLAAMVLVSILITCFSAFLFPKILYWIVYTFIEESLNWFLFGYFIFMFYTILPAWVKNMKTIFSQTGITG